VSLRLKADTSDESPQADEEPETREIRATVFRTGGGVPYIIDVETGGDGTFTLPDTTQTYQIAPGSVWEEGGTERVIVNEDHPTTINAHAVNGDDVMDPQVLNGLVTNNYIRQLDDAQRRQGVWQRKETWAFIAFAGAFLLLVFWQIKTIGDGFEQLAQAIENVRIAAGGSGHQDISPKG
jgi:hypothetical protein